jgi:hypothetical protein
MKQAEPASSACSLPKDGSSTFIRNVELQLDYMDHIQDGGNLQIFVSVLMYKK